MDDYYRNLPKKRMGVGALVFNQAGELLILQPTYKEGWTIPGGVIEHDESPRAACAREIKEEIGLDLPVGPLVCVDYTPDDGRKGESLQFIFHAGAVAPDLVQRLRVDGQEIAAFRFAEVGQALALLPEKLQRRLRHAIAAAKEGRTVYLEGGNPAPPHRPK